MTTLYEYLSPKSQTKTGAERRIGRRHDMEMHKISVERVDNKQRGGQVLGEIVDISNHGVRIRTNETLKIGPDHQLRVRIELPAYAGICPFVDTNANSPQPKNEWVGWMAVSRVKKVDTRHTEVAGRLMDMDEMDRGMLGLYLSTQPLAA